MNQGHSIVAFNMRETIKRGGKRPGAGRKPSENKKIRISTSLAPDVVKLLKESDKPIAQTIEEAVRNYASMHTMR